MPYHTEDFLILAKTYPLPSSKYRETTCVAAVTRQNELRRIYPVPFRFLDGSKRFRKWEWIRASVTETATDSRPESRRMDRDSIQRLGEAVGTDQGWARRWPWISPHVVTSAAALEERRQDQGNTIGILRVSRILALEVEPAREDWTDEERTKLGQKGLFDSEETRNQPLLRKVPYEFRLRYEIDTPSCTEVNRHLITDWELAALYFNCVRSHGALWELPFRGKIEKELAETDLHLLMGTVHRFPNVWIAASLIYPPNSKGALQIPLV